VSLPLTNFQSHLESIQSNVTGGTWRLLTQVKDWNEFSNHTPNDGGSAINSLEAIHDNIHTHTGWGGHMGNTYVAGNFSLRRAVSGWPLT
jgi:tyrosinase